MHFNRLEYFLNIYIKIFLSFSEILGEIVIYFLKRRELFITKVSYGSTRQPVPNENLMKPFAAEIYSQRIRTSDVTRCHQQGCQSQDVNRSIS
ncbi:unnamed protein product [Larinioides sclopetarius]|uniref:Uncharacterized protein n=1 Tax=Larinioides sclopetarius TaxID=280406 RepID=A0AAV1Z6D1_9ARAC